MLSGPITDLWAEQDTNPDAIEAALRELLRERHAANEALAPARVLNLVVIVDREWKGEIANRLERVGRYTASRTVLCAVERGRTRLDAFAVMNYKNPKNGSIGVMHEQVEIDMGLEHLDGIETIVDPVVASDLPTVLWSPHGHEEAVKALLPMTDVMLVDSDSLLDPADAFAHASELIASAYVVDLAWLRTTPWRERLAASFDPARRRAALNRIAAVTVRHRAASVASALLLVGWLASRLHWEPARLEPGERETLRGVARRAEEDVAVELDPVEQESPGLGGVTVTCARDSSLSLDRGAGGLRARERSPGGEEREWQVLGASRGEGGILGEGVRQALLRDPTYGPALAAARLLGDVGGRRGRRGSRRAGGRIDAKGRIPGAGQDGQRGGRRTEPDQRLVRG
jgi:glucose-6-phosphate dehydrogenase assembly protein OpcA